jgi:acetyl esterase/lipase
MKMKYSNWIVRNLIVVFVLFILPVEQSFAQQTLLWLENSQGIIENFQGSVIRWENQITSNGDATQSNSQLGGEKMEETYPGKVNVGFNKNGSFLALEGSSTYFSDNTFSVFYVGKVGDVNNIASLFGNMRPEDSLYQNWSGFRFVRKSNGDLAFQYANPAWSEIVLKNLSENDFFFFGFALAATGEYKYFDNTFDDAISGSINGAITHSSLDHNLNLLLTPSGSATYDHTEVAELMVVDNFMGDTKFQEMRDLFSSKYPEIVENDFEVVQVAPGNRTNLLVSEPISITFSDEINTPVIAYPSVYLNKTDTQVTGSWSVTDANTLTFTSAVNWPVGALIKIVLDPLLESIQNSTIDLTSRSDYNFIVETDESYGTVTENIPTIATRNGGTHNIPLVVTLPSVKDKKVPVHFWIHGGGWSGGTVTESFANKGPHSDYLAEHLGIATMGVAYRCTGSNGTFAQAMEDIDAAYQWAKANADTYNLDMSKVFFSGGSAGAPLAALATQIYPASKAIVGFNGIYNFQEDDLSAFGSGNFYEQEIPNAAANSAFYQLRTIPAAALMLHGTADTTININQSIMFAQEVSRAGSEAKMVEYEGEPHAFFNSGREEYEDVLYEMVEFLKGLGLTQNDDLSVTPPLGLVEIRNQELNGWLESTLLPDPTSAAKKEVRLNLDASNSNITYWSFVESPESGWYFVLSQSGDYLQLTNIVDVQNNTTGLALRTSDTGSGSWVKWKLVESSTTSEYHLENQEFQNYLRATQELQDGSLPANYVHGAASTKNGPWAQWKLLN